MRTPAQLQPAQENLPAAKLTRLAGSLADQAPPVDVARVASLRTAIANGSYGVHPAIIASALLDFPGRGTECCWRRWTRFRRGSTRPTARPTGLLPAPTDTKRGVKGKG